MGVAVGTGVAVGVAVGSGAGVAVGAGVGVGEGVGFGVGVGTTVGVGVGVDVGAGNKVGLGAGVGVNAGEGVGVFGSVSPGLGKGGGMTAGSVMGADTVGRGAAAWRTSVASLANATSLVPLWGGCEDPCADCGDWFASVAGGSSSIASGTWPSGVLPKPLPVHAVDAKRQMANSAVIILILKPLPPPLSLSVSLMASRHQRSAWTPGVKPLTRRHPAGCSPLARTGAASCASEDWRRLIAAYGQRLMLRAFQFAHRRQLPASCPTGSEHFCAVR